MVAWYDYEGMGCDACREILSARLDGEGEPAEVAAAEAHLGGCPACRRWRDDAAAATRLVRTGPALPPVDVTDAVLPAAPGRGRARLGALLRVALGLLGTGQVVLGLIQVTAHWAVGPESSQVTTADGATPEHLWHEAAAWNLAVGAAFLWVAARRTRPTGVVPILTAFVGALAALSVLDLVAGRVELTRLASHGLVVLGYLVVLLLTRVPGEPARPGAWARFWRPHLPDRAAGTAPPSAPSAEVIPFPDRGRAEPAAAAGSEVELRRRAA